MARWVARHFAFAHQFPQASALRRSPCNDCLCRVPATEPWAAVGKLSPIAKKANYESRACPISCSYRGLARHRLKNHHDVRHIDATLRDKKGLEKNCGLGYFFEILSHFWVVVAVMQSADTEARRSFPSLLWLHFLRHLRRWSTLFWPCLD